MQSVAWTSIRALLPVVCGIGLWATAPPGAHATVLSGTSSAYAESISLSLHPLLDGTFSTTSGPLPSVSDAAPPPYSLAQSVASLSAGFTGVLPITTGTLNVAATSDVDGLPGLRTTSASASTVDFDMTFFGSPVLSIGLISSDAQVSGDFGSLSPSGGVSITNVSVFGTPISASNAPNTVLFDSLGLTITSNAQTVTANSISVDGLDIVFNNVNLSGEALLNGSVILSQSQATETAVPTRVPEPVSLALLGTSLLALGLVRHRS